MVLEGGDAGYSDQGLGFAGLCFLLAQVVTRL